MTNHKSKALPDHELNDQIPLNQKLPVLHKFMGCSKFFTGDALPAATTIFISGHRLPTHKAVKQHACLLNYFFLQLATISKIRSTISSFWMQHYLQISDQLALLYVSKALLQHFICLGHEVYKHLANAKLKCLIVAHLK
jgi:hypothetical protein